MVTVPGWGHCERPKLLSLQISEPIEGVWGVVVKENNFIVLVDLRYEGLSHSLVIQSVMWSNFLLNTSGTVTSPPPDKASTIT